MPAGDTCTGKSPVDGTGLFAAHALPARHALGEFVGVRLTAGEFSRRKAAGGAHCLVRFTDLDGQEVFLDGEGRSDRAFVNSVAGTGCEANVEFVCNGVSLEAITLRAVAAGEELLADYELAGARGAARRRQMARPPPVRAVEGTCQDVAVRLQSACSTGGGFAERQPLAWRGAGEEQPAEWDAFLAHFGAATTFTEACAALKVDVDAGHSAFVELDEGNALKASAPPRFVGGCTAPVLHAFVARGTTSGRGRPVAGDPEIGHELGGCVLRVLCGALDVWVAAGTAENALLFGEKPERPAVDYVGVRWARLEKGALLVVPGGAVWQMACCGAEVLAVTMDIALPLDAWDVAAGLAWRLRAERDEATRRAAAAAVAACFRCGPTPVKALKAMKQSDWGKMLALV